MNKDFSDSILGEFKAGKYGYDGMILHSSMNIRITLDEKEDITTAHRLCKDVASLLDEASAFAANKLTALANEWREEDTKEISETDFTERIRLNTISVQREGHYTLWFHDDNMFCKHAVCVYGSIDSGLEKATIEG